MILSIRTCGQTEDRSSVNVVLNGVEREMRFYIGQGFAL